MYTVLSPGNIKQLCEKYFLQPSKHYGQHYLISDAPLQKLLEAGALTKEDTVVEIGPGFGVLTLAVAPLVKKVLAFEIEQKLRPYWEEKQKEFPNVEIVWGNALNHLSIAIRHLSSYKILANLPYQITSDALRVMLHAAPPPEKIVLMVQKEVAERICAAPPKMSLLSAAVQYYGAPKIVTVVPAGSFWPRPKVDSAIMAMTIQKESRTVDQESRFFEIVRAGFSHKRKQVWRNLAAGLHLDPTFVKQAIRDVAYNEKVRAEEISIDDWRSLADKLFA